MSCIPSFLLAGLAAGLIAHAAARAQQSVPPPVQAPPDAAIRPGLYRAPFEQGLAALGAGRAEEAAGRFRAAGERAPDAAVWRAYLARALGEELPEAPASAPDAQGPWTVVPHSWGEATFDPTGERLLSGGTLWDARTGERVAVLTSRLPEPVWDWRFDRTGRLVVGLGRPVGSPSIMRGLDVRDARTGDPIEVPGAAEVGVRRNATFEWLPAGTRVDVADRRDVFQLALPDGVLRIEAPATRTNEDHVLAPGGERAVYLLRDVPSTLRLVDPRDGAEIATLRDAGWRAFFSGSGRFVASLDEDRVLLIDAASGERLPDVPAPVEPRHEASWYSGWACAFDGDLLVVVDRTGRASWWDPAAAREQRRVQLEPPPGETGMSLFLALDGDRLVVAGWSEIRCYDAATGRQVWADEGPRSVRLFGGLAQDGRRLVAGESRTGERVLDVRTGEVLASLRCMPLDTGDVEVLAGADACVVAAADGSLRRVVLATGTTTAVAREHAGSPDVVLRSVDAQRLLTWDTGELLCLRDPQTLAPSVTVALEPGEQVLAVAPDGARVVTLVRPDRVRVRTLAPRVGVVELEPTADEPCDAAFSRDGSRIALVTQARLLLLEAASGTELTSFDAGGIPRPGPVAFYDDDRVALGWGDEDRVGVDVFRLADEQRVARLDVPECFLGGYVADLRCDPDAGLVVFSVSSCGMVMACGVEDGEARWTIDYSGGNPSTIELQRPAGSARLHVAGMDGSYARVVDLATGEVLAEQAVDGLFDLDGSDGGRFVVGTGRGGLVVLSGESLEPLYLRHEGAHGSAWLVRDGRRLAVVGDAGWDTGAWHLTRGGTSRPTDCWDAWLVDPLGLCQQPLDALPEPPRLVVGPPRALSADGGEVTLEVEAFSESPLLGVQVEVAGRATQLVPVTAHAEGTRWRATTQLAGPWPAHVRLRALARSGVLSAPWRVDVERAR